MLATRSRLQSSARTILKSFSSSSPYGISDQRMSGSPLHGVSAVLFQAPDVNPKIFPRPTAQKRHYFRQPLNCTMSIAQIVQIKTPLCADNSHPLANDRSAKYKAERSAFFDESGQPSRFSRPCARRVPPDSGSEAGDCWRMEPAKASCTITRIAVDFSRQILR